MGTPAPAAINLFCDSDGPVCNFDLDLKKSGLAADEFKHLPGTYLWLEETPGARTTLTALKDFDDKGLIRIWILTKTPSGSPYAYTEKVLWYRQHFQWLEDRVILTHDKHLLGGKNDFLLDDRPHKANANLFKGEFIYFDVDRPIDSWNKCYAAIALVAR